MKKCKICSKSVYPVDPQVNLDGLLFHKQCAKCEDCSCQISTTNFRKHEVEGEGGYVTLVCTVHYNERIIDRGHLWYTSEKRERERVAAQAASIESARRRESLLDLGGKSIVATNATSYKQMPQAPPISPTGTGSPRQSGKKWPPVGGSFTSQKSLEPIVESAPLPAPQSAADTPDKQEGDAAADAAVVNVSDIQLNETPASSAVQSTTTETHTTQVVVESQTTQTVVETVVVETTTTTSSTHTTQKQTAQEVAAAPAVPTFAVPTFTDADHLEPLTHAEINSFFAQLAKADATQGRLDTQTLSLAESLGTQLKRKRLFVAAEVFYKQVWERRLELLGEEHLETIDGISMLADLYHKMKKLEESEALYRRALAARERVQGVDHEATLYEVNDLACVCARLSKYTEAEALYNRVLEARTRVCGEDHEDTLISVHDYAALLEEMGRFEEAEKMYMRAVDGRESVLGPENADTLDSITCLALVLQNLGKDAEAEAMYLRAMDASERAHGATDKHTCDLAYNLGNMYEAANDWPKALEMYEYAHEGYAHTLGDDDDETRDCADKLAIARERVK